MHGGCYGGDVAVFTVHCNFYVEFAHGENDERDETKALVRWTVIATLIMSMLSNLGTVLGSPSLLNIARDPSTPLRQCP